MSNFYFHLSDWYQIKTHLFYVLHVPPHVKPFTYSSKDPESDGKSSENSAVTFIFYKVTSNTVLKDKTTQNSVTCSQV